LAAAQHGGRARLELPQARDQGLGQNSHAVLVALAVANQKLAFLEADVVLHVQARAVRTAPPPCLPFALPDGIEQRVAALVTETGRTKTALAREGILERIDDLEDYHLAEARAAQLQDQSARGCGARSWPVGSSSIPRS
jgi:RHH-type rel operon transcriptional repressor/antitoxin RelB